MSRSIFRKITERFRRPAPKELAGRLLHLTIQPNAGSCEHFYHFMLGYLLPLAAYLAQPGIADDRIILLRSCGPLDRLLRELAMPGLLLCERFSHSSIKEIMARAPWAEIDKIKGFDFGVVSARRVRYDAEGVGLGMNFLRHRLAAAIDYSTREIEAVWKGHPRILLIERADPDPFYYSSLAHLKGSANERRSIGNHAELAAALAAIYPGFRNLKLETLPLAEQAAWFGLTDILVAQHGAALSNILWMRRGTHVIEIDPDSGNSAMFGHLAPLFGVSYVRLRQDAGAFGAVPVQDLAALIAPLAGSVNKPLAILPH